MEVSTWPFAGDHIPAAIALWRRVPGVGLSDADSPANLQRFLQRNPGLSHAALIGKTLVGTILCGHDGRRGLIHHLVVDAPQRGAGLGSRLLALSLAGLHREGIAKAHLMVYRDNDLGHAFWRRHAKPRDELSLYSIEVPPPTP